MVHPLRRKCTCSETNNTGSLLSSLRDLQLRFTGIYSLTIPFTPALRKKSFQTRSMTQNTSGSVDVSLRLCLLSTGRERTSNPNLLEWKNGKETTCKFWYRSVFAKSKSVAISHPFTARGRDVQLPDWPDHSNIIIDSTRASADAESKTANHAETTLEKIAQFIVYKLCYLYVVRFLEWHVGRSQSSWTKTYHNPPSSAWHRLTIIDFNKQLTNRPNAATKISWLILSSIFFSFWYSLVDLAIADLTACSQIYSPLLRAFCFFIGSFLCFVFTISLKFWITNRFMKQPLYHVVIMATTWILSSFGFLLLLSSTSSSSTVFAFMILQRRQCNRMVHRPTIGCIQNNNNFPSSTRQSTHAPVRIGSLAILVTTCHSHGQRSSQFLS